MALPEAGKTPYWAIDVGAEVETYPLQLRLTFQMTIDSELIGLKLWNINYLHKLPHIKKIQHLSPLTLICLLLFKTDIWALSLTLGGGGSY